MCGLASCGNLEVAAKKLVRPLPSLRYIFITTSRYLLIHGDGESANGGAAGSGFSSEANERREVIRAWRVAEHSTSVGARGTQDSDELPILVLVELHKDVAETII